jgi:molybdopterin/thiamine biosynthesis adenylyltransferase
MRTEEQTLRFKDAPWFPKKQEDVIIGGSGGIGSWLAFLLARANFEIHLFDFDTVEERNMAGQFFQKSQIGQNKINAVKQNILNFSDSNINVYNRAIDKNSMYSIPYVFSAFDNMKARKDLFNCWKRSYNGLNHPIFIDGRLEMEQLQIFCVTPETADLYESEHLFNDSEVEAESCTARQTTHTATLIASLMVAYFTNHITNVYEEEKVRDFPFFTEFFTPLNLIKNE